MADWLTARPIAHRGLHDAAAGIVENTSSAIAAAIAANYGIEVDLQITSDGDAVVHHDESLGRLTEGEGDLRHLTSAELRRVAFKGTADRILTLAELCDLVAGRSTLLLELKSRFDGDDRLPRRVAQLVARYSGPVAAMSFDPARVSMLRTFAPMLRRGLVAQSRTVAGNQETSDHRAPLVEHLKSRPQFLAYSVEHLPATLPMFARVIGIPILTWTVRTEEDRRRAKAWADQIIFEGFRP